MQGALWVPAAPDEKAPLRPAELLDALLRPFWNLGFAFPGHAQIEKALEQTTINYGSHAGMSLVVSLDNVERQLRPGDTVLLAPEYEHYNIYTGINGVMI